jgi:SAM-dependent methyltransferase
MYEVARHQRLGNKTESSAKIVVEILRQILPCGSVLDVGCGDGRWLAAFAEAGACVRGVDGPWTDTANLRISSNCFAIKDLMQPFTLDRRFDVVVSLEVAEHLPESTATGFVKTLVRHSNVVLFSAAIPYQGGYKHINEQWQSYWIDQFAQQNYVAFDPIRSQIWTHPDVYDWYKQNIMLFVNAADSVAVEAVTRYMIERKIAALPIDVVHPECYARVAQYEIIAFKSLLRQLPRKSMNKVWDLAGRLRTG